MSVSLVTFVQIYFRSSRRCGDVVCGAAILALMRDAHLAVRQMFSILSKHFCSPVGSEGRGTDLGTE